MTIKTVILATITGCEYQLGHEISDSVERLTEYARTNSLYADVILRCVESTSSDILEEVDWIIGLIKVTEGPVVLVTKSWDQILIGIGISSLLYELCAQGDLEIHLVDHGLIIGEECENSDATLKDFSFKIASCKSFHHYDYPSAEDLC